MFRFENKKKYAKQRNTKAINRYGVMVFIIIEKLVLHISKSEYIYRQIHITNFVLHGKISLKTRALGDKFVGKLFLYNLSLHVCMLGNFYHL